MTRAVHTAVGSMHCELAVWSIRPERGVVTFFNLRHKVSQIMETAAPVSISACAAVPSTLTSITFCGEKDGGLKQFELYAAVASGAAAISFPLP